MLDSLHQSGAPTKRCHTNSPRAGKTLEGEIRHIKFLNAKPDPKWTMKSNEHNPKNPKGGPLSKSPLTRSNRIY